MQAVVLEEKGKMTYRELPTPQPHPGQVLLRMRAAAICGSDLHRYVRGHRVTPLVLGHEAAGEISAVGDGVPPDLVGQHAALIPLVPCLACDAVPGRALLGLPKLFVYRFPPERRLCRIYRDAGGQCPAAARRPPI